jgi:demethylmenaquinone methyltransferase/2-methoxy-6-polyprenyl-1,4-benzoquinol methylase
MESPSNERGDEFADFGYQRVPHGEKKARVRGVFDSVAANYDLMNDVMSFGLHRLWKRFTVARTGLKAGQSALDVAAGSADLSIPMARQVGPTGRVVVTDINREMLAVGRDRLLDAGIAANAACLLADAKGVVSDQTDDVARPGFVDGLAFLTE